MKTLIFACLAFVGTLAYSASISWGTDSTVNGPSGTTDWAGTAFLYMVESSTGSIPSWSATSGWDTTGAMFIASGSVQAGEIYITSTVDQSTQFKSEGSGYYYVLVYTTSNAADLTQISDGYYAISDTQELFDGGTLPGSSEHFGELYFNADGTLAWSEIPVPEPTVLALLALGVAGLALRRRVA